MARKSDKQRNDDSFVWKKILRNVFIREKNTIEGYTQSQFAESLGLNRTTLSRYMNFNDKTRLLYGEHARLILANAKMNDKERKDFVWSFNLQALPHEKISLKGLSIPEERVVTKEERLKLKKIREAKSLIDVVETGNFDGKTLIVSTAMEGASAHREFLASIETFQKVKKAEFFLMSSKAHLAPLSDDEYPLDDIILERHADRVRRGIEVNKNLHIRNLDIRPYKADPLGGKQELGAEEGRSYIFAHPQQRMKTYPNGMSKVPRIQWTTGMVTYPLYRDNEPGLLADQRHVIGALIVEVRGDKFLIRDVQADVDGSFVDLGVRYKPDGTEGEAKSIEWAGRGYYINRGDDHVGFQDQEATNAEDEAAKLMEVDYIFVQDIGDCASVSHHREKSMKARLRLPECVKTLDKELKSISAFLDHLNKVKPEGATVVCVPSNHPEHLTRYIDENRFIKDVHNYECAVELAYQYQVKDKDPFIHGVDPEQKKALWLPRSGATFRVGGVAIHHGDKGPNGSRGSVKGDCVSYGKSAAGHSHSPENWRGARRSGTSTHLSLDYTEGSPSSWAHAFELAFRSKAEGEALRQTVFVIDGEWTFDKKNLIKTLETLKKESKAAAKKKTRKKSSSAA